jgi:hypothetical protein
MSKKTRRIRKSHIKRHRTYKKHRTHKRERTHKRHRTHNRHHSYRKRREIVTVPGSKGIPLFSAPINNKLNKIMVNSEMESGNMIPGLRNM